MSTTEAKFSVGQIIHHRMFDYRGVVIDVDPEFQGPEEWYDKMARSRPPKEKPWYHVLVDGSNIQTYVAEQNLEPDQSGAAIQHPEISLHFTELTPQGYITRRADN